MRLLPSLFGSVIWGLTITLPGLANPATSPIAEDRSLSQPSTISRQGDTFVITGGTRVGNNVFHSFERFSVPTGRTASFRGIDSSVTHIFSRITGSTASQINGVIEVLQSNGSAHFFLLNPNGVLFGPNASINVGGSFVATTADRIRLADGTEFSAVAPTQSSSLLTVSLPVGLQFGDRPGSITTRSVATRFDQAENLVKGLAVAPGQTIALIGGPLNLTGGIVSAAGGRVELGSVAGPGWVQLSQTGSGWQFGYDEIATFGAIQLSQAAIVDTSSPLGGGAIHLHGGRISLSEGSQVTSQTQGSRSGAAVRVTASEVLTVAGGLNQLSFIETNTIGAGAAGDIDIDTQRLVLRDGGLIGSITYNLGQGGNVRVNASDAVLVDDRGNRSEQRFINLYSVAEVGSMGNAGQLTVTTDRLHVRGGGQIASTTHASGAAGTLTIQATEVDVAGFARNAEGEPLIPDGSTSPYRSAIASSSSAGGDGGPLRLNVQRLRVRDGATVQATTFADGNPGDLSIRASDSVEVSGAFNELTPSAIDASSVGSDQPATLTLVTDQLTVQDGARISALDTAKDRQSTAASRLEIQARSIQLLNRADVTADTASGDGGRINVQVDDLLVLRRGSQISTDAGVDGQPGNGGDITIDSPRGFVIAVPSENSDISTNAFADQGGTLDITAQQILGFRILSLADLQDQLQTDDPAELLPFRVPTSDLTALSRSSVSLAGQIVLNTPDVDPSRGLVELPSDVLDPSDQIAQACPREETDLANRNQFIVTGRSGLPTIPGDLKTGDTILTDWATLDPQAQEPLELESSSDQATRRLASPTPNSTIVEAQGWVRRTDGTVKLIADAPEMPRHAARLTHPHCHS